MCSISETQNICLINHIELAASIFKSQRNMNLKFSKQYFSDLSGRQFGLILGEIWNKSHKRNSINF